MKTIIYDKLIEYGKSGKYPLHMPGHKRQVKLLGNLDPFDIDITEIEGFDNLHYAKDLIKDSMDNISEFYQSKKSWLLVNGSSGGILAAIGACTNIGDNILIGRNCHKSVYHGIKIRNLKASYIYPSYINEFNTNGAISAKDVEEALCESNSKVVVITSPTYDGIVSDIEKIAEVVHKAGAILIVDQAHGAHFMGSNKLCESAGLLGADIVIESVHKTLPSLTQTAIIHLYSDNIDMDLLEENLSIYQTSSPSYLFMASIDKSVDFLENSEEKYNDLLITLDNFREQVSKLDNIILMDENNISKDVYFDLDKTKLLIKAKGKTGRWLGDRLREFGFEPEMEAYSYVLGIITACDDLNMISKLAEALKEIDKLVSSCEADKTDMEYLKLESQMTIYDASIGVMESVLIDESEGLISGDFVYLYPPGIPLVVPGELISKEVIQVIDMYKSNGFSIEGMKDKSSSYIQVKR